MSVQRRGLRMPIRNVEPVAVKAGVLAGATYPADELLNAKTGERYPDPRAGLPVAAIAAGLEYGHGQAHPRPFMQETFARERQAWVDAVTRLVRDGRSPQDALRVVGQVMKEDIQTTINDWPADNAPEWAEVKGFNKGLTLSGHLLRSIESAVVEGK